MRHTPGPWRVHQHDQINGELWLSIGFLSHEGTDNPDGRWIGPVAELKYLIAREDEQRANAQLIAAAPDLLAVLKAVLAGFEANAFCRNTDGDDRSDWAIRFFPHLKALADATVVIAKAEGAS